MTKQELEELGYESEQDLIDEVLGTGYGDDNEYTSDDFYDSWDPD